jgi:DNA-binding response OmpR family regulator
MTNVDQASAHRVILIDDSPLVREMIGGALRDAGIDARVAADLSELDRLIAEGRPDLVLVDVQMPEAFGDDVAMVLRDVRGLGAPIYLFSAIAEAELAERAAAIGIEGYISKRIGVDRIVERVRVVLAAGSP